jgi:hypothetical protein
MWFIQSCSINTEITYFKDATSTSLTDIDAKEMLDIVNSFPTDSSGTKKLEDFDKIPKTWTSFYDMKLQDGKEIKNEDSAKILKKSFIKSNFDGDKITGFSIKFERFTKDDYENLIEQTAKDKDKKLPINQGMYSKWDGKTLTLDTENFNVKDLENLFSGESTENSESEEQQMKGMTSLFNIKMTTTLKFENKIKNITGKHDWVKQIDDHSVKIDFDTSKLFDEDNPKPESADSKIVITTE